MRSVFVLAIAVPLLLGLLVFGSIPRVQAAPIYFEDDFDFLGCAVGVFPPGWTSGTVGVVTNRSCEIDEFFPDFGAYDGRSSFKHHLTSTPIDTVVSPVFSIGAATQLRVGFAARWASFPTGTTDGGGNWAFNMLDGIGPSSFVASVGLNNSGVVHTFDTGFGMWQSTGFQIALDTWYVFTLDHNRTTNLFDTEINSTAIDTGQSAQFTAADVTDRLQVGGRGGVDYWFDWLFTDLVSMDPVPAQTATTGELFLVDVDSDAGTDVIFGLAPPTPGFLTIGPQGGLIEGTPPASGTFTVNATVNTSTSQDFFEFSLTVSDAVDPILSWLRTFGPAWVIFLSVVVIIFILVRTLWRGARRSPRRRDL